jgi:SulP family sulfate permease
MLGSICAHLGQTNLATLADRLAATAFLFWVRKGLKPAAAARLGLPPLLADVLAKAGPVAAVAATTLLVWGLGPDGAGRQHRGRPSRRPAAADAARLRPIPDRALLVPAILISVIGFVESSRSRRRWPRRSASASTPIRS